MSISVEELNLSGAGSDNQKNWDAFVKACPEATFFHLSGWKQVIEQSFGQNCRFLMARRNGEIEGVFPLTDIRSRVFGNRLVSTGWCVGGGVAASSDEAATALFEEAAKILNSSDAEYIESKDPARSQPGVLIQEDVYAGFERAIDPDEDACLKQIPRKQRAVVRKAIKAEIDVDIDNDPNRCYDLYAFNVRNHGTPVFSRKYFHNLMSTFGDDCDVLTVSKDGVVLSSVLSFYFRDKVMPFYTGAAFEARKLGAADYMYWQLMRRASARGYSVFDFGRSKYGTGPFSFKKNWGFEPRPIVGEFLMKGDAPLPNVNPNNPKYKLMIKTWQKLPLPIANLIGPWVGKQVG